MERLSRPFGSKPNSLVFDNRGVWLFFIKVWKCLRAPCRRVVLNDAGNATGSDWYNGSRQAPLQMCCFVRCLVTLRAPLQACSLKWILDEVRTRLQKSLLRVTDTFICEYKVAFDGIRYTRFGLEQSCGLAPNYQRSPETSLHPLFA